MRFLILALVATLAAAPAHAQTLPPPTPGDTLLLTGLSGQSNGPGEGNGSAALTPVLTPAEGSEFYWTASTNQAHGAGYVRTTGMQNPMCDWLGPGYKSKNASSAPAFAQALHQATGRRVITGMFAKGGTGMYCAPSVKTGNYWRPGYALANQAIWKWKGMEAATGQPLRVIVHMQGEREAQDLVTYAATYTHLPDSTGRQNVYTNYLNLFNAYYAAFPGVAIILVETGTVAGTAPATVDRVRAAQAQVVAYYQGQGKPMALVTGAQFLATLDGTHLAPLSQNAIGTNCAAAAATFLVAPGPPPAPADPPPTPIPYDLNRAMRATGPHKPRHVGQPMMKRRPAPLVPHQRPPGR